MPHPRKEVKFHGRDGERANLSRGAPPKKALQSCPLVLKRLEKTLVQRIESKAVGTRRTCGSIGRPTSRKTCRN